MRILRSKGTSYTRFEGRKIQLNDLSGTDKLVVGDSDGKGISVPSRGLLLKRPASHTSPLWDSADLPDKLESDLDLALRQYIQWLDKALRKPKSLRQMDLASYVARTHVGERLWQLFAEDVLFRAGVEDEERESLRARWRAKVHPYARHEVNWDRPDKDMNADEIRQAERQSDTGAPRRFVSATRWTTVFKVPIGEMRGQSFLEAAVKVQEHLQTQEFKIDGEGRKKNKDKITKNIGLTGYGLLNYRGQSIETSTNDPRVHEQIDKFATWNPIYENLYCEPGDVACQIALDFDQDPRSGLPKSRIGKALYDHFGVLLRRPDLAGNVPQDLWNLHNAIRLFYRRTVESNRFLEAVRCGDQTKLSQLLPRAMDQLLERVSGKRRSGDINRHIRLGKVIAHAVDLCATEMQSNAEADVAKFDSRVRMAMDYYVTSLGQADIKRNEAFVRVLRTSVAFAQRSLSAWISEGLDKHSKIEVQRWRDKVKTPPDGEAVHAPDRDLTTLEVRAIALTEQPPPSILERASIILGAKRHELVDIVGGEAAGVAGKLSRTDILFGSDSSAENKEVLWCLLELAAQIRHGTYHFNTKTRLLHLLRQDVLRATAADDGSTPFIDRDGRAVSKRAKERLERLLDYDLQLEATILSEELNRLRFPMHVPPQSRAKALEIIRRIPSSDDRVTPKFMRVLKKARDLAVTETKAEIPDWLRSFSALKLNDLSKTAGTLNHDRVGLLRLLYDRGFTNWLEEHENDEKLARHLFELALKAKRIRRSEYDQAKKIPGTSLDDETMADSFLTEAKTLSDLEMWLAAEALLTDEPRPDESRLEEIVDEDVDHRTRIAKAGRQPEASKEKPTANPNNPYIQDRMLQSEQTSRLQDLRLEVYSYLFAHFLADAGFGWVWTMREIQPDEVPTASEPVAAGDLRCAIDETPSWLRLFYAWLYLVPVDQIALLRHQFRKTAILERKGAIDATKVGGPVFASKEADEFLSWAKRAHDRDVADLRSLDRLMGLYTRVQAAGFSGTEVAIDGFLARDVAATDLLEDAESRREIMLPGTLAGLRQMRRFGTIKVLEGAFAKHRVTKEEVAELRRIVKEKDLAAFQRKQELHQDIVTANRQKPRDEAKLKRDARAYRELAAEVCNYNFDIGAARLSDFANLHHLLMEILARLADFTAIWERDRDCVVLARAYEGNPDLPFVYTKARGGEVTFGADGKAGEPARKGAFVYSTKDGFRSMVKKGDLVSLARCERHAWANRYFGLSNSTSEMRRENAKDVAYRELHNPDLKRRGKKLIEANIGHHLPIARIRNDLAHFNVLDRQPDARRPGAVKDRKGINLTYIVNAVRALLSYDRKLKNAVPKAIADILQRQGIAIRWDIVRDRLRAAKLQPVLLPHLDFVRPRHLATEIAAEPIAFFLPAVSARRLSLTRSLFDFGSSGYLVDVEGKPGVKQLGYPEHVIEAFTGDHVPTAVFRTVELPSERI